jgi:hypothetical protein
MMGRREGGQGQFFYSFDLDKVVPPDHLIRQIDRSSADNPDADRGLRVRDPLGAEALR